MASAPDTVSTLNGTSQSLQNRLNDPQTVQALHRLLDRVDTLATAKVNLLGLAVC